VNFVASAGNQGPGPPRFPASLDESFAVAASGRTGNRCRFSNGTPQAPVNLTAPGCDSAWPWDDQVSRGTSPAAAATAGWLAALRSYHPGLSAPGAETALSTTGRPTTIGPAVNVAAAFAVAPGILDSQLPPAPQIRRVRLGRRNATIVVEPLNRSGVQLVATPGNREGSAKKISIPLRLYRRARLFWSGPKTDGTPSLSPATRLPSRASL
jgi:Subtilase family